LNVQGFPEYRHRQTGIVFVRLPGGMFWMGAQKTDPKGQNYDPDALGRSEGPVHEVTLSPFMIGKYEVIQAQWKSVMGSNPSGFKGDDRPVEQVSWDDIQGFEAKTGLRLPSEAQWEYACRGGSSTPFAGTGNLDDLGWYEDGATGLHGGITHPVGKKSANGFGLHDMHGNVREWCEDVYDAEFYSKPEASEMNPICQAGSGRVFRGGSWDDDAVGCRSAYRAGNDPAVHHGLVGFRVVYRLP
jgi:formylglycine-generating enzyme required for sulfatase activity